MLTLPSVPRAQCIVLPSEINRQAFRPDRIMIGQGRNAISLEEWRMDRDLDAWDRCYPDRLPNKRYDV